jgi:hypothetical protein
LTRCGTRTTGIDFAQSLVQTRSAVRARLPRVFSTFYALSALVRGAALSFESIEKLDREVDALELSLREPPRAALFLAGQALREYRHAGGTRTGILSDFFIGAHAAVLGCGILTRDAARYRSYFPTVELLTPRSY